MAQLVDDVLLLIFNELRDDISTLHSCILVNTMWCHIAIPLLWKNFSSLFENPYNFEPELRKKLYNVIAHFLPNNPGDPLPQYDIQLPLNRITKKLSFEYMSFFTRITTVWIKDMADFLINNEVEDSKYKKKILEKEIYRLIINKCKNTKYFHWNTKKKIYKYSNAEFFFSNLNFFEFNFKINFANSKTLHKLSGICKDITNLEIVDCNEDAPGLVSFIETQKNLQSLSLYFIDNEKVEYNKLKKIIEKKAATLKKFTLQPVTLISPRFVLSLKNIQYLTLDNDGDLYERGWRKWTKYLGMASFPHLKYLETAYLPNNIICLIIENSGGHILEIYIRFPLDSDSNNYQSQNKKLILAISNHCPKLINLTMEVGHRNLCKMKGIFSNCMQLEKLFLTTNSNVLPNGDKILLLMSKMLSTTLKEFSFGDKFNFSLEGLRTFFENWKSENRSPFKFIHHYDDGMVYLWTSDHDIIVVNYKNEGVIR
ncbi:uncharacterized protein OCT59_001337 [Rhizophagus irregularis]|uniref:F-box domain-containing protein n=1 Tax=Rhizophagus irregularis (strain DAOM 181602 / DAOM 197198 / MUCL 43194) TaxID=747089 RepID=U9UBS7_RHIID|nr:hypothetical protein OCT59_001337 [Rhizophagus irregularis]GBC29708.1 hypothetical protein GLOIN_2v1770441 [Rhizophagus irregularis DAOM 181602=DAOM 197198]